MSFSFYPATVGRTSTAQSTNRLIYQINTDESAIQKLQTQLSTGRRIERPSEDPAAAIRALGAQRALEFKGQVVTNLKSANTILAGSESILSQVQSTLNEMRGIAIQSAGNTLSDSERQANADQVLEALRNLVELGNSKIQDQHIFSGSNVLQAPLKLTGNAVQFTGTDNQLNTITDLGATMAANVTADQAFGTKSDKIVGSVDLDPALAGSTPLNDLNFGAGVRKGSISLSDGTQTTVIDLTKAYTIQDVADAIEAQQVGSRSLDVTINQNGITIDYLDGQAGTLRVNEVGSGLTAGDLGIRTSSITSPTPVVGKDLNLLTTNQTSLSQLFGGTGIPNASLFTIRQGNQNYTINTAGMKNVEDLINGIQQSGARVKASLDPTGKYFAIQSTESGTTLSIGEAGGDLASRLGVRTLDASTPVSQLNSGQGIFTGGTGLDLRIARTDGTELLIDLSGVQTVGDVINKINNNVDNFDPQLRVTASLNPNGNGLVLSAPTGAQQIQIINNGGSQAATGLGLVPSGQASAEGATSGTESVISGIDVSGIQVEGAFNTLLNLEKAIRSGDTSSMERLVNSLDSDINRVSTARAMVGARQQSIDQIQTRTEDQQVQLKQTESNEIDTDFASVISELTGRQTALQASLKLMGNSSQLSLFDYI